MADFRNWQVCFTSKELAVVANVGSLVQPLTRAQYQAQQAPASAESVFSRRSAIAMAEFGRAG